MKRTLMAGLAALALAAGAAHAQTTLRIGLAEDPDALDPTFARTFVGRIVFAGLCDKLFDIDKDLKIVPQLATGYEWSDGGKVLTIKLRPNVLFHDGEKMDAEAVRFSLDRHLNSPRSGRRAEISVIKTIEVVDPLTVKLTLSTAFAPLIAQFTDRAGMMVSPKAATAAGDQFAQKPVCAGPFKFVERVAQDRIVLEKFPQYWNAANVHFDRVIYRPISDSSVRLANLKAGALDMIERMLATDVPASKKDAKLVVVPVKELGYQGITFNLGNGEKAKAPIGADPRVREAFELAIDRNVINQVVYNGEYTPTVQAVPPSSPYHNKNLKVPGRDVAKAKALLAAAGQKNPVVNLTVPNSPDLRQVAEILQSMTKEAGFDLRINVMEFASSLNAAERGDFEAYILAWSGRPDPDGNLYVFITKNGPQNYGKYFNADVDKMMDEQRAVADMTQRQALLGKIMETTHKDLPILYLWHRTNFMAHTTKLTGFQPVPDAMIRLQGMKLAAN
ncbi:MAG: ABC transporter substrate-binding protein [Alphaproteobacteria bacterium]|nr:ABC transporter substrate-binding protein [Alphaproteobacteria bacterium]